MPSKSELAGMLKHHRAVLLDVLIEANARRRTANEHVKRTGVLN
jgi:hypothetical protein